MFKYRVNKYKTWIQLEVLGYCICELMTLYTSRKFTHWLVFFRRILRFYVSESVQMCWLFPL